MGRFFLTIAIGAIVGLLTGIAIPILWWLGYWVINWGDDGGVGTFFAILLLITIPGFTALGTIIGTIVGAMRD